MKVTNAVMAGVALVTLVVFSSCPLIIGSASGSDSSDGRTSRSLFTVSPTQGAAGSVVQLTGLGFSEQRLAELELWIGGEPTVFGVDGDVWTAALPLFLDETGWPRPPDRPLSVELRENDAVVATARQKVTVTELPPAPGTTAAIQNELDQIVQGYAELLSSFGGGSDYAPAVAAATIAALNALINEGDYSLAAVLDGTSPLLEGESADLELIDALLSVSGTLEYLEALNELLNGTTGGTGSGAGIHALSAGGVTPQSLPATDRTLAAGMQIYVIIDDLSAAYFGPNAQAWARVTGAIAITRVKVPYAAIVGAILTVTDFVMGSVVPGILPATIAKFELTLDESVIEENELTSSTVQITADNSPPVMTVTEVIQLAVTALGLRSSVDTETFSGILYKAVESALNRFNRAFSDHIAKAGLDPVDEFSVPHMTWGPVEIRNPDLVELVTSDPSIVAVDEEAMEWRGIMRGTSNVRVRTRSAGARSNMLPPPFRAFYHGGAFGNNSAWADASIQVGEGADLALTITGLPAGVAADVFVEGSGFKRTFTESTVIEDLEYDSYMVFAFDVVDSDDTVYTGYPEVQTIEVTDPGVFEVTVAYRPRYGDLELEITGLPPGVAGDVMLIGPDYERQFAESQLIENLVTGSYTVEAREVVVPGSTFEPTPATQTVDVTNRDTAVAEVVYQEIRDLQLEKWARYGPYFEVTGTANNYDWRGFVADFIRFFWVGGYTFYYYPYDGPQPLWLHRSSLNLSEAGSAMNQLGAVDLSITTNEHRADVNWNISASSAALYDYHGSGGLALLELGDTEFHVINDRGQHLNLEVSYSYALNAAGDVNDGDIVSARTSSQVVIGIYVYVGSVREYTEIASNFVRLGEIVSTGGAGSLSIPISPSVSRISVYLYGDASAGVGNRESDPGGRTFSASSVGEIKLRLVPAEE